MAEGDGMDVSFDGRPGKVVGEDGEDEVFALVTGFFLKNAEGIPVKPCPYSKDPKDQGRTDDRSFRYGNEKVLVQIVAAQPPGFWKAAAKGTAHAEGDFEAAAGWVREAVEKKNCKHYSDWGKLLVAVDFRHMGFAASEATIEAYLRLHGDPAAAYKFGGVLLVGPKVDRCFRLGTFRWKV